MGNQTPSLMKLMPGQGTCSGNIGQILALTKDGRKFAFTLSQEKEVNCPRSQWFQKWQSQNWNRNWAAPESFPASSTLVFWNRCHPLDLGVP